ncbi:response regulator transcription factor [Streptomyces sp. HSW2009]|uniref:helix-turn-helix transcriptional regulator n=1 Tax=Streptomyces sp. HSW2009 TaxID=3142890 RepID=UPI0032EB3A2E
MWGTTTVLSSILVATPSPTEERIQVAVYAADPISSAGVVHHLAPHPALELVEPDAARPDTVAVFVADSLDDTTLARLRKLVRTDGTRSVLVVHHLREPDLMELISCGVGAVVWRREATAARLFKAVLAASRGDGDLPADLLGRLLNQVGTLSRVGPGATVVPTSGLSPREVDVLRLVADGFDTKEIADKLSYSERTIKNVMQALTSRLHLRNRAHAVAHALREGYI